MTKSSTKAPTGFDRFGLDNALLRGIAAAGFENPRPIQNETIPAGLEGRDVLGLAQTGTGKTAAFALPLLDRMIQNPRRGTRALIIAPTRELATQIAAEIRVLSKFSRVSVQTIFGGVPMYSQVRALRNQPEIIVGCPGRMLDLLRQGVLHLGKIETLVLDEADHMFDMGFLPDIRAILAAIPKQRQNLLFSATMPKEIRGLANDLLNDPHVVELANRAPAATIDHALYMTTDRTKSKLLQHMLNRDDCESAIVFTRTKRRAACLAEQLNKAGHRAVGLQGNLSQAQRDRAMRGFRTRKYDVLVATDIVARGIDVSNVSYVINYDVPNTPEAYTHRIGRTGRSERQGVACTLVTGADHGWVKATERMLGSQIPRRQVDGFGGDVAEMPERSRAPRGQGGQNGEHRSGKPKHGQRGGANGRYRRRRRRAS